MRLLEDLGHGPGAAIGNDHGPVRALVTKVGFLDHLGVFLGQALIGDLAPGIGLQSSQDFIQPVVKPVLKRGFDGLFPVCADIGQPHAIGAEYAGKGVNENTLHPQGVGDQACVLAPGATETVEGVSGDVITALHGNLLDGVGHVLDRDFQEPLGDLFGGQFFLGL